MAYLENCLECGASISSKAQRCPKCGANHQFPKRCYACGQRIKKSELVSATLPPGFSYWVNTDLFSTTYMGLGDIKREPEHGEMAFHRSCYKEISSIKKTEKIKVTGECDLCHEKVSMSLNPLEFNFIQEAENERIRDPFGYCICSNCGHKIGLKRISEFKVYYQCIFCRYTVDLSNDGGVFLPGKKTVAHKICYSPDRKMIIEGRLRKKEAEEAAEKKKKDDNRRIIQGRKAFRQTFAAIVTTIVSISILAVASNFGGTGIIVGLVLVALTSPIVWFMAWLFVL